jgi:hypothetical protein
MPPLHTNVSDYISASIFRIEEYSHEEAVAFLPLLRYALLFHVFAAVSLIGAVPRRAVTPSHQVNDSTITATIIVATCPPPPAR